MRCEYADRSKVVLDKYFGDLHAMNVYCFVLLEIIKFFCTQLHSQHKIREYANGCKRA